jgi:LysR family transcriptional regulator, glycine cleavage system transcriptional activator
VSYQIKLLEERVGTPLFLRRPRQVALSEAGERLAPQVAEAFDRLRTAFGEVHGRVDGTLAISAVPTFASQWLAANLGLFQVGHPQIAVRIESSPTLVDFAAEEIDVAIRATRQVGPGLVAYPLARVEFAPMLHPRLIEEYEVRQPADLLRVPQITPDDPWVDAWYQLAGIKGPEPGRPFARLGYQSMEAAAAMAGRGVAMLTPMFYGEEIRAGRLVQPFPITGWLGDQYWLVYPEGRRNNLKIKAFRDWLVEATAPLRAAQQTGQ